jgi:peptide-methionine (R)-S-oxide reductase
VRFGVTLVGSLLAALAVAAPGRTVRVYSLQAKGYVTMDKVEKSEEEWRRTLTPEQFRIMREKGTERAFTGAYWDNHGTGTYRCAACGLELFRSDEKFDSGTGWPSFTEPVVAEAVELKRDLSHGMIRTEVVCRRCGGHLGHVFDDGPGPTGQRWCINSCSLDLDPRDDAATS